LSGSLRFAGRVVVVTGAGGGLGSAYAREIAARGGAVVVNDLDGAAALAEEIAAAGAAALANADSVAEAEGCAAIIAAALERFGRIDAVIANAGNLRLGDFADTGEEVLDALLDVHLKGSFHLARAAWPHMAEQDYGRIVLTTSSAGMLGMPRLSAYGAAKGAVAGLMGVLAEEGRDCGIRVNAVMPNAASRMTAQIAPGALGSNPWTAGFPQTFDPRFNAGLAAWLAHESCQSTHAIYSAAGGRIARVFVGVTRGWDGPLDRPPSMEEVAANFAAIGDEHAGFAIPANAYDEFRIVAEGRGR
jgi:NAD(P)-dependent dehydrogenase (short-subunit alcohol dehydrogenase family)